MQRRNFIRTLIGAAAGLMGMPAAASHRSLRGLYRSGEEFLGIGAFTEFGEGEFLFDYQGTRAAKLILAKEGVYRISSTFTDEGGAVGQLLVAPRGVRHRGKEFDALDLRRSGFSVKSGAIEIAGEVSRPAGRRPLGVVLPIWGSGPGPHRGLDYWTFQILASGWAVATYDKRGSGASTGDWRMAGFDDLSSDVRAVLAHARTQFRGLPVGLMGLSQGGWIAPMLAAEADFLVLHGGATVTPAQQTLAFVEGELKAYGLSHDEIAAALSYYALDIDVSRGRRPWADLQRAYESASGRGAE